MNAKFLLDGSDFRSRGGGSSLARGRRDSSLFWWTILITLLLGLATFCWFFSIMVFKYPEKPFHYKLLTRLEKLDPITQFDPLKIPNGAFHGPRELLAKYYNYNSDQLRLANDLLKRSYILNYASEAPVYVKGAYKVIHARPLSEHDVMSQGWVVRGQSVELSDVEVELLLPGADPGQPPYNVGDSLTLDNKVHICSVINVERNTSSDGVCATVTPLTYTGFTTQAKEPIKLAPPLALNMEAPWPVVVLNPAAEPLAQPEKEKVTAQATP